VNKRTISIITAVLNNSGSIGDCLRSVKQQTYAHIEHIVVDGGSTDGTQDRIQKEGAHIAKFVSGPDRGLYDALNKGLKLATGDIVGVLHADDLFYDTEALKKIHETLTDDEVVACYGDLLYVERYDTSKIVRYWRSGNYTSRSFYWGWMPPHPTFFVKRTVYDKLGLFNLTMGSAADYELMLRFLLKNNVRAAYIPEILVKMRVGGTSNASLANRIRANRNDRKAWEVNGLRPYPWTLLFKPLRKIPQYFMRP
jgi:glycosyltransferase involved in cell wall biosynthesis